MSENRSGAAVGLTYFASLMMIIIGFFDVIQGLSAIIKQTYYAVSPNYVFKLNVATWGWINLLLGLVILLAGFGLWSGAVWARTVGVIMATIIAVAEFAWLPYSPIWSVTVIALSIFVIWALTAHGRDVTMQNN
jgi:hypothetical protein